MNFKKTLISGEFIKRYKRFFVDVKINTSTITAHCPNTGSMMGLLKKGNKVWLSKSNNPKRKLKYTLEIIESKKSDTPKPKKVIRIDKKIANIIDCATNNEAFFLLFAPILLPIKVFVPAVSPTPIAIIIK